MRTWTKAALLAVVSLACSCASMNRERVTVAELDAGAVQLIGALGSPLGTFHTIEVEFAMVTAHGRAGQGGRLLMKVFTVDGEDLPEPIYLPYFKAMTLQDYELFDGTDIFPRHPRTNELTGRAATCLVYEDILFLDLGSNPSAFEGWPADNKGFAKPAYRTALGIRAVK